MEQGKTLDSSYNVKGSNENEIQIMKYSQSHFIVVLSTRIFLLFLFSFLAYSNFYF